MSNFNQVEIEAVSGILGWVLHKPEKLMEVTITPDMISSYTHREVFSAILRLQSQGNPFSPTDVQDELDRVGFGDQFMRMLGWIENMNASSPSGIIADIEARFRKAHSCRTACQVANQLIEFANRGDIDSIQECISPILTLNAERKNYDYSFTEMMDKTLQDAMDRLDGKVCSSVSTGITALDNQIGGFHNSDLIILAARPAMGKTALMINMALGAGEGKRVGLFSGEQGVVQMGYRVMAIQSGAEIGKLRQGMDDMSYQLLTNAMERLSTNGGRVYDKPAPTITDICSKAREWKLKYNIDAIYIDYLQRVKPLDPRLPKHEQVGQIAVSLKELARELDIPVIALAQVNRAVEARGEKRPGTGDIKDSGVIEQEADQILTLYRDEVYHEDTQDKGLAEIDVKKNRHGATGCIPVEWRASCMKFLSLGENWNPAVELVIESDKDDQQQESDWRKNDPLWG